MGAIGGLLGLNGGQNGTGFSATPGTNAGQLSQSYNQVQGALGGQNQLLDALKGQQGLQNQSNVYNQTQGIVAGQGPNPAQAMLNQATGQNVSNQAALMAGQRGASGNVGLMARQNAQTGAGLQQAAAGQGASMQAQQSLGALGQAGNMANAMAGNQIGQTNANVTAQQNLQNTLQGANTAHNNIQGQLASKQMEGQQKAIGGIGGAIGSITGLFAEGGAVPDGSAFSAEAKYMQNINANAAQGNMPQFGGASSEDPFKDWGKKKDPVPMGTTDTPTQGGNSSMLGIGNAGAMAAHGGKVKAMVSPGEKFLDPNEAKAVAKGNVSPMKVGETIPGQAKVKGDSYKNDTVRKDLETGGVVIPRSVMNSKDPVRGAADFVRSVMAKKGKK